MALSDTCKGCITVLCQDLARHANGGQSDTGGEDAFIAIYHLASCAANLDHNAELRDSSYVRRIDDYFLGILIEAFAASPNPDGLSFLVKMVRTMPDLADAFQRYNALHKLSSAGAQHTLDGRGAQYLAHIVAVCDATDQVFEDGEEAQSPPS